MNEVEVLHPFSDVPLITEFTSRKHHKRRRRDPRKKYNTRLFFYAKQNLELINSDVEATYLSSQARLSYINLLSSSVALEEQTYNSEQIESNYEKQINIVKSRAEEEIKRSKQFYAEQMFEYKGKLDELKPKAESYEKKAERYTEREKQYFQKAAEYEIYKESMKLKSQLEQLNKENADLQKEYEKFKKAKIKFDARKLEKQKKLMKNNKPVMNKDKSVVPNRPKPFLSTLMKK